PESVKLPRKNVDMPQTLKPTANAAQIEHWNAVAGTTWAQFHELLDRQIDALGLAALDALEPTKGEQVLDIGCGCGQTSLALADRVGSTGSVVGVWDRSKRTNCRSPSTVGLLLRARAASEPVCVRDDHQQCVSPRRPKDG